MSSTDTVIPLLPSHLCWISQWGAHGYVSLIILCLFWLLREKNLTVDKAKGGFIFVPLIMRNIRCASKTTQLEALAMQLTGVTHCLYDLCELWKMLEFAWRRWRNSPMLYSSGVFTKSFLYGPAPFHNQSCQRKPRWPPWTLLKINNIYLSH